MILQALVGHYEDLIARGDIAPPGWAPVKVSFALELDGAGVLKRLIPLKTEQPSGKKASLLPQIMGPLPAPVKRASNISANFLWDNSSYLLGVDAKGKPQRSRDCFAACKALHHQLLDGLDVPAARAVLAFFDDWDPEKAREHPALQEDWEELMKGGNLVFFCGNAFAHEDPVLHAAWQRHYDGEETGKTTTCLVTGEPVVPQAVHPAIKGVRGAQSSGAALVSFNAPAFCSYGKEQNLNAPMGKYAAFAYTAALNHLLADWRHVIRMGDTTVVCWAQGGDPAYQDLACDYLFDGPAPTYTQEELRDMTKKLLSGQSITFDKAQLDPDKPFYILGLSPNAARLSVRFFLRNTFGGFLQNVQAHHRRLEIVRPIDDKFETIPLWKLLDATVNQSSRDKSPAPDLAGETLRSILTDARYPATLLNGVALRIRADHQVDRTRAAILKAYYLKNPHPDIPKEVLTVSLNPTCDDSAYVLGRLFSVYEAIQLSANPGINATIKDKYFNSAAATPATIFSILGNLAQKHLKKLKSANMGLCVFYEKQLGEITALLDTAFPARLSLPQQGSFQLGYYHQTQARYQKKEEK